MTSDVSPRPTLPNSQLLDIIHNSLPAAHSGDSAAERWWQRYGGAQTPRQKVYLDDVSRQRKLIYQQPPTMIRLHGIEPGNHGEIDRVTSLLKGLPNTPSALLLDPALYREGWQEWIPFVGGVVELPTSVSPESREAFVASLGRELPFSSHLDKAVELACANTLPNCGENITPHTHTQDRELYLGAIPMVGDRRLWHTRFQILAERLTGISYADVYTVLADRFASQSTVGWTDQIGALIQELRGLPGRALPQDLNAELTTLEVRLKEGIRLTPDFVKSEARTLTDHYLHLWFDILQAMVNEAKGPVVLGEDLWPTQLSPRHQKALRITLNQEMVSDELKLRGWFTRLRANLVLAGHQIYLPAGLILDLGKDQRPAVQPTSNLSNPLARTA